MVLARFYFLLMCVMGVVLICIGLPSATSEAVTCDGRVMASDDTCVIGTEAGAPLGIGSRYDYAEMKERQRRDDEGNWAVVAGGAGVLALAVGVAFGPGLMARFRKT
ncbi:hypothetical protein ACIOHE_30895 [Streptomyces sp. NPDC087851]|uniref:hypothetical protein n=1 Tax=Streptomyces sp. NPDC087851 TaxID=3365810 RepID=UPI00381DB46C